MTRESTLRVGLLTTILQRAGIIEEDEKVLEVEWDSQTNSVILFLEIIVEMTKKSKLAEKRLREALEGEIEVYFEVAQGLKTMTRGEAMVSVRRVFKAVLEMFGGETNQIADEPEPKRPRWPWTPGPSGKCGRYRSMGEMGLHEHVCNERKD